ncbi:serine/threonine-protein kinase [Solwaraspora sp. WMMD406]|uniref:serine/threonine-protein kinase n=1 Tax=Solwaraspora sp. WMMD406 TaxID=3016095 RepID=UPI002416CC16|nr:serine/threonine-protein kinase [Solwaraspora sp. WMMD406]MDG4765686.1 serine/threonine-protein kinase [Solwaraspora sp. WMMD406]
MVLPCGLRLDRRYVLSERIGLGGMSEVWRARDDLLDRPVAVKVLTPPIAAGLRAACRREARAAARITHPNVTQVYDYGEAHIDGGDPPLPYLVLELVEGENLAARLTRGPLPWPAAAWLTAQVASGLAAAHRIGVVHRDIKPGNIMLTTSGAKILDFGIAAVADGRPEPDGGWLLGTPTYAAPERLQHGPAHPAADVYALGALCYEMLTGSPPVAVRNWQEAAARLSRYDLPARPAVDGLPTAVTDLCLSCLGQEPTSRPAASEVAVALRDALGVVVEFPLPRPTAARQPRGGRTLVEAPVGPHGLASARNDEADVHLDRYDEADVHLDRYRYDPERYDPERDDPAAGWPGRTGARPRSMLALVGLCGAAAAAVMALAIVATAFLVSPPSAHEQLAGPPSPVAVTPTPSSAGRSPDPTMATPDLLANAALLVDEFDLLVADASTTGRIRADAAADLRDTADRLRATVAEGTSVAEIRDHVARLRRQLAGHRQEGTVEAALSIQLDLMLASLVADLVD